MFRWYCFLHIVKKSFPKVLMKVIFQSIKKNNEMKFLSLFSKCSLSTFFLRYYSFCWKIYLLRLQFHIEGHSEEIFRKTILLKVHLPLWRNLMKYIKFDWCSSSYLNKNNISFELFKSCHIEFSGIYSYPGSRKDICFNDTSKGRVPISFFQNRLHILPVWRNSLVDSKFQAAMDIHMQTCLVTTCDCLLTLKKDHIFFLISITFWVLFAFQRWI